MKANSKPSADDMRPEYDFSGGVRGKYFERFTHSSNVVVLEPDVAAAFPNSEAVNDALRGLIRVAQRTAGLTRRPSESAAEARRAVRLGA